MWPIEYKGNDSVRCLSLAHQRYYHFYRPSQGGPQHESFRLVLFSQQNETEIRSEAKLYSLIKECRGASSCKSRGLGCFMEILSVGRGWRSCGWDGAPDRRAGYSISARCPPPPAWTKCHAEHFCTRPCRAEVLALPFPTRNSGLKHRVPGLCRWCPVSKWRYAKDTNYTKGKRKGRPYFF